MTIVARHNPDKPIWFDVMTTDPDAARKFYGTLFGWTYDIGPAETGFYTMCKVGNDNAAGLGPMMPGQEMPPAWTVYFGVTDADATVAKVTSGWTKGVVVNVPSKVNAFVPLVATIWK